eukprot:CAMPEP_0172618734 /NCGR_PEP_ID=MMETSP1068-20121228/85129_1 /TAXON_ID=35684 /ORGANISM="Pseudopedinella elastica, Strain CCMP716" /LENGTH=187 /DNA_ID=CAMNT_0013425139 /DNA_START=32 /DNA_END=595 /DNA_ORIENTATION=-
MAEAAPDGGATTTKEITAEGAKVTSVATSNVATADWPEEPLSPKSLLFRLADEAKIHLFLPRTPLMLFFDGHAEEWIPAVEAEREGATAPEELTVIYRELHPEFLAIMEAWLKPLLELNKESMEQFLADANQTIEMGIFASMGPDYEPFVDAINAMGSFEAFNKMMSQKAIDSMGYALSPKSPKSPW